MPPRRLSHGHAARAVSVSCAYSRCWCSCGVIAVLSLASGLYVVAGTQPARARRLEEYHGRPDDQDLRRRGPPPPAGPAPRSREQRDRLRRPDPEAHARRRRGRRRRPLLFSPGRRPHRHTARRLGGPASRQHRRGRLDHHAAIREERLRLRPEDARPQGQRGGAGLSAREEVVEGEDPQRVPEHHLLRRRGLGGRGGGHRVLRYAGEASDSGSGRHAGRDHQVARQLLAATGRGGLSSDATSFSTRCSSRATSPAISCGPLWPTPVKLAPRTAAEDPVPYWVEMVREQLVAKYGANTVLQGGLRVYTSIDLDKQALAEKAISASSTSRATRPPRSSPSTCTPVASSPWSEDSTSRTSSSTSPCRATASRARRSRPSSWSPPSAEHRPRHDLRFGPVHRQSARDDPWKVKSTDEGDVASPTPRRARSTGSTPG